MNNVWRKPIGFRVVELEPKLYHFFFQRESDLVRVLHGNPWLFRNSWLIVRRWERNMIPVDVNFNNVDVKVQLWGLLEHCKILKLGRKLASVSGKVKDCE